MAGTFTKLSSGSWRAQIMVDGRRVSKTHKTKRDAERWALEQLEFDHGGATYSLEKIALRYQKEISPTKKGARWERVRISAMIRDYPDLFSRVTTDIKPKDIQNMVSHRLKSVQPSTVNRELNLLSAIFTQGKRWEMCGASPTAEVVRPKDPPPRDRRISDDEVQRILIALGYFEDESVKQTRQRIGAMFLLALETAMRQGELCGITWDHVSLERKTIRLDHTMTKTGVGRNIPLSSEAIRLLGRLPDTGSNSVFGVKPAVASTVFRKAVIAAGIDDLTFHDSRHEATTRLAQKLHVLDLARVTGHRDIKMLMIYYNKDASELADML